MSKPDKFIELLDDNTKLIVDLWSKMAKGSQTIPFEDLEKLWESRDKLVMYHTGRDRKGKFLSKEKKEAL